MNEKRFEYAILELAEKHGLFDPAKADHAFDWDNEHFDDWLTRNFPGVAVTLPSEFGTSPRSYYPSVLEDYAGLTSGQFKPKSIKCESDDNWANAMFRFKLNGKQHEIHVTDVNDSDYLSNEFCPAMNRFAEGHLPGRWIAYVYYDDWFVMYVPAAAYVEFAQLGS